MLRSQRKLVYTMYRLSPVELPFAFHIHSVRAFISDLLLDSLNYFTEFTPWTEIALMISPGGSFLLRPADRLSIKK